MSVNIVLNPVYHHLINNYNDDFTISNVSYNRNIIKSDNKVNLSTLKLKPCYNYQSDVNMLNVLNGLTEPVQPDGILYNHDYTKLKFIKNNKILVPLDNITSDDVRNIKSLTHNVDVSVNVTDKKYNYTSSGIVYNDYQVGPINYEVETPPTTQSPLTFNDIRLYVESVWNYLNPSINNTPIKLSTLINYDTIESHYSNTANLYAAIDSFNVSTAINQTNLIDDYDDVYVIKELLNNVAQTSLDTLRSSNKNIYSLPNVDIFYVIERTSTVKEEHSVIRTFVTQFNLSVVTLKDIVLSLADYYVCLVKNKCYEYNNYKHYKPTDNDKLALNKLGYSLDVTETNKINIDTTTLNHNSVGKTLELLKDNVILTEEELHNNGSDLISGTWGTCNWTLNYYGVLTINEGIGASQPNDNPQSPWINYATQIKTINITGAITFNESTSLNRLFKDLNEVTAINGLDKLDTTDVIDMFGMFYNCSSVYSIDVSNFDTKDVTNMSCMFSNCKKVESLDLSNFDTSKLKDMGYIFSNMFNLKHINLSNFNTSNVTNMPCMVDNCTSLTTIIFGNNWNTSKVTNMLGMFRDCSTLSELDLTNFDITSVTSICEMFKNCSSLTSLDLSNFNMNNVTNSADCLSGLTGLTKFTTPCDFGDRNINIKNNINNVKAVFNNTKWKIEGSDMKYSTITSVLANTTYIKQDIHSWGTCYWYVENDILYLEGGKGISTTYNETSKCYVSPFDSVKSTVTKIVIEGDVTFDTTTVINADGTLTETATVILDSLFEGFSNLDEIDGLDKISTANVASMNKMFNGCSNLLLLDLTNFDTTDITQDTSGNYNVQEFLTGTTKLFRFISPKFEDNDGTITTKGSSISKVIADSLGTTKWRDETDSTSKFSQLSELKSNTPYTKELTTIWGLASNGCPWFLDSTNDTLYITGGKAVSIVNDNIPWKNSKTSIKRVEILGNVTFDSGSDITNLFKDYTSLEEVNGLANIQFANLSKADNLLSGCTKLKRVDLSGLSLSSLTVTVNNIVNGCTSLVEFITPENPSEAIATNIATSLTNVSANWKDNSNATNTYVAVSKVTSKTDYIAHGFGYWGQCEFTFDDSTKTITVSPGLVDSTYTASPFKDYASVVTKIIIENGVVIKENISLDNLFKDLSVLETITGLSTCQFGDSNSRKHMFDGCNSLIDYDYNSFVTLAGQTFDTMFNECSALTSLDIRNFNFGQATSSTNFNTNCNSIEYIQTPVDNSTTANTMATSLINGTTYKRGDGNDTNKTFDGTPIFRVTNNLSKLGTCNVLYDNNVLSISSGIVTALPTPLPWSDYKTNIKQVKILGSVQFSVTGTADVSVSGLFEGLSSCTSIQNLKYLVGPYDATAQTYGKVTDISNLFKDCSALTELDLSDWDLSGVTTADDFVTGCTSLNTIKSPSSLPSPDVLSLNINKLADQVWTNVTTQNYNYGIIALTTNATYYTSDHGKWGECEWNYNETTKTITISGGKGSSTLTVTDSSGVAQPYSVFKVHRSDVTKIIIEDEITFDPNTTLDGLFKDLSALTEIINLKNLTTTNVTTMNEMFSGCSSLVYLDFTNFNVSTVTSMTNFLNGTINLIRLITPEIPSGNTVISSAIISSLGQTKWKTEGNTGDFNILTSVQSKTTYIRETQDIWGESQSVCCWTISNNTLYITGGQGAGISNVKVNNNYQTPWVNSLNNIKHINILGKVTFKSGTSLVGLFADCVNLISITKLSNLDLTNVISVESMFENCKSINILDLSNLDLPTTVTNMCSGCSILRKITFKTDTANSLITNIQSTLPSSSKWTSESKTLTKTPDVPSNIDNYYVTEGILVIEGGNIPSLSTSLNRSSIVKVKILSDTTVKVKTILKGYFQNLNNCTSFEGLEYLDTSLATDMSNMFSGCNQITTLDLSTIITHSVTDMSGMFMNCGSLSTLTLNSNRFRTDNVTNMADMFNGCNGLTKLDVSYFNTDRVTSMSQMFQECANITELNLSKWSTSNVTNMSNMFNGCSNLIEVDLSNFDTSSVTTLSAMFNACSSLTHINFSSFRFNPINDGSLVNIFNKTNLIVFRSPLEFVESTETSVKTALVKVLNANDNLWKTLDDISNINVPFKALDTVNPDTIYVSNKSSNKTGETYWGYDDNDTSTPKDDKNEYSCRYKIIGTTLFIGPGVGKANTTQCPFVTESDISKVKRIKILGKITFEQSNGSNINVDNLFKGLTSLTTIEGLEYIDTTNVNSVSNMFNDCNALTKLTVPISLISNGVTNVSGMFQGCSLLERLRFVNYNTPVESKVTNVSNWFNGCNALVQVDLSMFKMESVTSATDIFKDCNALLRFVTPASFGSNTTFQTTIKNYMGSDWKKQNDSAFGTLTNIEANTAYVRNLSTHLWGTCVWYIDEETKTLHISGGEGLTQIAEYKSPWDEDKSSIKEIKIHGNITLPDSCSLQRLFYNLYNLETIDGFDKLKTNNVTDMLDMFRNCYNLKTITSEMNNNGTTITNVLTFDLSNINSFGFMFANCYNLTHLTIQLKSDTNTISVASMFYGCYSLSSFNVIGSDTSNKNYIFKVSDMTFMFNCCYNLKLLDMTNWELNGVTDLTYLCNKCYNLQSIEFKSTPVISGITNVNNMFNECYTLNKLDLSMFEFDGVTESTDWLNKCVNLSYFKAPQKLPTDDNSQNYLTDLSKGIQGKAWFDTTEAVQYTSSDAIILQESHVYIILNSQNDTYRKPTYPIYYLYKSESGNYTLQHMIFGDLMISKSDFSNLTGVGKVRFVVKDNNETVFRSEPFILDDSIEQEVVIKLPNINNPYGYLHTLFNDLILKDSCIMEYTQLELTRYDFRHIESIQNCAITCDMILFNTVQQVTFKCDKLVYDEDIDKFIITNGYCVDYPTINFNGAVSILSDRILALATLGKTNTNLKDVNIINSIANRPTLTIIMKNGSRLIGIPKRFNIDNTLYDNTYITPLANSTQLFGLTDSMKIPYDTPIIFDNTEQKIRPIRYVSGIPTQFKEWTSEDVEKGLVDSVEYDIKQLPEREL